MKRVAIETLGCKVNQYDSELLKQYFNNEKFISVSSEEAADIYVINTCTVTAKADQEAKHLLRRYRRKNPEAMMVITGCSAQTRPEEFSKLEGVHYVVGNTLKDTIVDLLKNSESPPDTPQIHVENSFKTERTLSLVPIHAQHQRTRVFLKIQDGCDDFCTFCVIPYARGRSRSQDPDAIIHQVNVLVEEKVKEIVLTGVSLGSYGQDLSPKTNLADVVRRIEKETRLSRLRISSLEPEDVNDELLDLLSNSDIFCPHFHLPLQSGSDSVLKKMRRNYDVRYYQKLLEKIAGSFGDVFIGTDVICGFPRETNHDFKNTLNYLGQLPWSRLHVFPYSPREGTPAAKFAGKFDGPLTRAEILERGAMLRGLSDKRYHTFLDDQIGKPVLGLIEKQEASVPGHLKAITRNYLPLLLKKDPLIHTKNEELAFIPTARAGDELLAKAAC